MATFDPHQYALDCGWDGLQFVGAEAGAAIAQEWEASGRLHRYA